jgi:MFS family permease
VTSPVSGNFRLRSIAVTGFGPSALFGLSQGAILPVIAISAIDRGATIAVASFVVATLGLGALVTNIPSGILATRIGERRSMLIAAGLSAVGLVLCLFDIGLVAFAIGIFLVGAASSIFMLARQSYLTEVVPVYMRARAMSTLGGVQRIGVFVGPFITAGVIGLAGLDAAYVVALISIVGSGVVAYFVPELAAGPVAESSSARSATTIGIVRTHWRMFVFLGTGIVLLSAIRTTRQVVIPLWATHLGLDPAQSSIVYGIAGVVDAMVFYPAGFVMDRFGRKWIAIPCVLIMGVACVLLPLTSTVVTLTLVAAFMGFGNGIGSGIVNTLGSDVSPSVGRPTFIGIWRELADTGSALGPLVLSVVAGVAGLAAGIVVSGLIGFAAAAALWRWIPKRAGRDQTTA